MKKHYLYILSFLFSIGCNSQPKKEVIKIDSLVFDISKGSVDDTISFDLNADNKKDILLRFSYDNFDVKIPRGESGQVLAIYVNSGINAYRYIAMNKSILWLIHNSIKQIDDKTFVVLNEGSGQDWNRYYCYFEYDAKQNNWFMIRYEVYRYDDKNRILVEKKLYSSDQKILFEKVSFDILFGKLRAEVPEPSIYEKIRIEKSIIYSSPSIRTKMYLVKGDEVEIIEERERWLKIRYYGKKPIEGWIKKSDVE